MNIKQTNLGFSLLEITIALGVFSFIAIVFLVGSINGFRPATQGGQYLEALSIARSGLGAVLSIRDRAWNDLEYNQSGVEYVGGSWQFKGEGTVDNIGDYSRTITFHSVCRSGINEISECPASYTDPTIKLVNVEVTWTKSFDVVKRVVQQMYVTAWESTIYSANDWSGGPGQDTLSDTTMFQSDDGNIDYDTPGMLTLKSEGSGAETWIASTGKEKTFTSQDDFSGGVFNDTKLVGTGFGASITLLDNPNWLESSQSGILTTKDLNDLGGENNFIWTVGQDGTFLQYDSNNWSSDSIGGSVDFNGVVADSSSNVWAVGSKGKIYHYNGVSWQEDFDTGNETWNDVVIKDNNDILAVGNSGSIATRNDLTGIWSEEDIGSSNIISLYHFNDSNIWAVGNKGNIWLYNGSSWQLHTDTGNQTWNTVVFQSQSLGWVFGSSGAYAEYNGASWTTQSLPGEDFLSSALNENSYPEAVDDDGNIFAYNGSTWDQLSTGDSNSLNGILINQNDRFIVGDDGKIYEYGAGYSPTGTYLSEPFDSQDPDTSWDEISWTETIPAGGDLTISVRSGPTPTPDGSWTNFTSEKSDPEGSNVGGPKNQYFQWRATFTRGTSGETPILEDITLIFDGPTKKDLHDIDGLDDDSWATGSKGVILENNNNLWTQVESGTNKDLFGIAYISSNEIYAAGKSDTFLVYDGNTWQEEVVFPGPSPNVDWFDIDGSSSNYIFAVGESGEVVKNIGAGWVSDNISTTNNLNSVYIASDNSVWVSSDGGNIYMQNGGSWQSIATDTVEDIYDISSDGQEIWAVADGGLILKYTGGSFVTQIDTGDDIWQTITFSETGKAWAMSEDGLIYLYENSIWQEFENPTDQSINSVAFVGDGIGYAVADDGTILTYKPISYALEGTLISSAIPLSDPSPVEVIMWTDNNPACNPDCLVKFQIRTAPDDGGSPGVWGSWYGASGVDGFYTTSTGHIISNLLNGNEWMQYRVILEGDGLQTPELNSLRIFYR